MGTEIATLDVDDLGPAMLALNPRQRNFVDALCARPDISGTQAAAEAGYAGNRKVLQVTAHRLMHDAKVLEALHEQSVKRMHSGSLAAVSLLLEMMTNPKEKANIRKDCAIEILNRTGLHTRTEHHVKVEHSSSDKDLVARIKNLAKQLKFDDDETKKLLGGAGVVIDAEFKEVEKEPAYSTDGLEDLL